MSQAPPPVATETAEAEAAPAAPTETVQDWTLPRWLYRASLALVALLALLVLLLAPRQAPHPDALRAIGAWDLHRASWWLYPLERNAFRRLVIAGDLQAGFGHAEGGIWLVGSGGLILHSLDGGASWTQQLPRPSAAEPERQALWEPLLGRLLPAAHAAEPPDDKSGSKSNTGNLFDPRQQSAPPPSNKLPPRQQQQQQPQRPAPAVVAAPVRDAVAAERIASLHAVHFVDARQGWVAGVDGAGGAVLLRTDDSGQRWRRISLPAAAAGLRALAFSGDGKLAWAAGDAGSLLTSRDGGQSWQLEAGADRSINWLQLLRQQGGDETLWLVGNRESGADPAQGLLQRRDRAGRLLESLDGFKGRINGATLHPRTQQAWLLVSGGRLWQPTGSGQGPGSWSVSTLPELDQPLAIQFDAQGDGGWIVGAFGRSLRREAGSQVWQPQSSGTDADLLALLQDGKRLWALGRSGSLLAHEGEAWQRRALGLAGQLRGLAFTADGQRGWAGGGDGLILRTDDGGAHWQALRQPDGGLWHSLQERGGRVWAIGKGRVQRSQDGGASWQPAGTWPGVGVLSNPPLELGVDADGRSAWATALSGALLRLPDGGQAWTQPSALQARRFGRLAVDGRRLGLADGDGTLWLSEDGGANWTSTTGALPQPPTAIAWATGSRPWLGDAQGNLRAGAAGLRAGDGRAIRALAVHADGRRAWAAGSGGLLLATVDGGARWEPQPLGEAQDLQALALAADGQRLWLAGDAALLRRSLDGGRSWQEAGSYRRHWAPWAYLLLLNLAAGAALLLAKVRPVGAGGVASEPASPGAATALASDQPVQDKADDRLGFGALVEALSGFIRNAATEPRVTLAVSGEWGSGKSSVMRMLQTELQRAGFRTAWFNAWHQQQEGRPMTALFNAIRQQAVPGLTAQPLAALRVRSRLLWGRGAGYRLVGVVGLLVLALLAGDLFGGGVAAAGQRVQANVRHHLLGQQAQLLDRASLAKLNPFEAVKAPAGQIDLAAVALACAPGAKPVLLAAPPLSPAAFCAVAQQLLPTETWAAFSAGQGCRLRAPESAGSCRFESREQLQATLEAGLRLPPHEVSAVLAAAQVLPPPDLFRWLQGSLVGGLAGVLLLLFTKGFSVYGLQLLAPLKGLVGARLAQEDGKETAGTVERYREEFRLLCEALDGRLVVFIDDLDRCSPETVNRQLELTNYLVDVGRCFVVIGAALDRVKQSIKPPVPLDKPEAVERYAAEYLRKLIHVELPVPRRGEQLLELLQTTSPARASGAQQKARGALLRRLGRGLLGLLAIALLAGSFLLGNWLHGGDAVQALALDEPLPVAQAASAAAAPMSESGAAAAKPASAPAANGPAGLRQPASSSGLPVSAAWLLGACGLVLMLALLWRWLGRYREVVTLALGGALREHDSPRFLDALKLWSPLVIAADPTPRQVKRFYNRARLLAAFGGIDEANLVALAAIDQAQRDLLTRWAAEGENWGAWLAGDNPAWADVHTALRQHADRFKTQPAVDDVRRFVALVAGLHVR
jgi:photosystem II stability/assembly factor-like uncharacterized protein